jgi:hypothetical protein
MPWLSKRQILRLVSSSHSQIYELTYRPLRRPEDVSWSCAEHSAAGSAARGDGSLDWISTLLPSLRRPHCLHVCVCGVHEKDVSGHELTCLLRTSREEMVLPKVTVDTMVLMSTAVLQCGNWTRRAE